MREIKSQILRTLYNTVQNRSISSRGKVRETHIHHSRSYWTTMAPLLHPFIFLMDIYTIINIHSLLYMSHSHVISVYTHMIYIKEKYCFYNIPGKDLLSLVTIVIAKAFKKSFLFFLTHYGYSAFSEVQFHPGSYIFLWKSIHAESKAEICNTKHSQLTQLPWLTRSSELSVCLMENSLFAWSFECLPALRFNWCGA